MWGDPHHLKASLILDHRVPMWSEKEGPTKPVGCPRPLSTWPVPLDCLIIKIINKAWC